MIDFAGLAAAFATLTALATAVGIVAIFVAIVAGTWSLIHTAGGRR